MRVYTDFSSNTHTDMQDHKYVNQAFPGSRQKDEWF